MISEGLMYVLIFHALPVAVLCLAILLMMVGMVIYEIPDFHHIAHHHV